MSPFTRRVTEIALGLARPSAKCVNLTVLLVSAVGGACSDSQGDRSSASVSPAPSVSAAPDQEPSAPLDPLAPGASVVCGMSQGPDGPEPELYVVYAMNRKLRQYPEFASSIGMDLVSDCEGAREFRRRYSLYYAEHTGFDADEPLGDMVGDGPALPPVSPEIQKILNGQVGVNDPVVNLLLDVPPNVDPSWKLQGDAGVSSLSCSGTFINKNWILTAAHCVTGAAIYKCLKEHKPVSSCTPAWEGAYAPFKIVATRSDDAGAHANVLSAWLRAYVHPDWQGRSLWTIPDCEGQTGCYEASSGATHDLALLYVNYGYDGVLPPNVEDDAAKRLSIVPPQLADWSLRFYGWGQPPDPGSGVFPPRVGTTQSPFGDVAMSLLGTQVLLGTASQGLSPFICKGDSGGPLVRAGLQLSTNVGTKSNLEAIIGVASARSYNSTSNPLAECKVAANDKAYWTRVDTANHQQFIKNNLKRWAPYKTMSCKPRNVLPTASPDQVEECWGKPCDGDANCGDGEYCYLPAAVLTCSVCGPGIGCGCVKGQCAPKRLK